eukprot:573724_1
MSEKLTQLDEWNALFGCNLTFTCDLSTGEISVNGVVQTDSKTPAPTLSTSSPTESTGNPSRLPTQVTNTPTLGTSSPTGNPSHVPTQVTGAPITAAPAERTDAPTSVPTETTSGPTSVSSSPTGVSPSPTHVPSAVLVLSSTAVPTCATDDECNDDECEGECEVVDDCRVCVSQGSLANTYSIGVTVWIGFVTYVLQ